MSDYSIHGGIFCAQHKRLYLIGDKLSIHHATSKTANFSIINKFACENLQFSRDCCEHNLPCGVHAIMIHNAGSNVWEEVREMKPQL